MSALQERMTEVIQNQPEDASYEDIIRELIFAQMIARGLDDSRQGRTIANDEVEARIREWQK